MLVHKFPRAEWLRLLFDDLPNHFDRLHELLLLLLLLLQVLKLLFAHRGRVVIESFHKGKGFLFLHFIDNL
jgi:hypothetical protein